MPENKLPTLWTAWCSYSATGEGVSYMARIAYAPNAVQCRQEFEKAFGEFWASMCHASPGVVRNEVTEQLFSVRTLDRLQKIEGAGVVEAKAQLHLNFS